MSNSNNKYNNIIINKHLVCNLLLHLNINLINHKNNKNNNK